MFFRIFNLPKNKLSITVINLILLTCFIITMNGCSTTRQIKYSKGGLEFHEDMKIKFIILKDGTKINVNNKQVIYKDSTNSLMIYSNDSLVVGRSINLKKTNVPGVYDSTFSYTKVMKPSELERIIPINDVLDIYAEKTETDIGLTIVSVVGIIVGLVLLIFLIAFAMKESCPFVYSFDGTKYVFDGEPLGGAICDGLARTDYSRMENLKPSGDKFKLLIRNEADEKQFLDEIKLLVVPNKENTYVTPNPEGEFFSYKTIINPESVKVENGNDVSLFFKEKDNIKWQTQMPYDTSFRGSLERHNLKFRFPKPKGAKNALLLVNCGTALWGSYMIKAMLQLRGDKVDNWYDNINSGGIEKLKLYQFMDIEELFTLKVNLLEGDSYKSVTYIPAGGPFLDEDKIIRLPLGNVTGDFVEFTLNPPAGFWKIDQVGIIYDYEIIEKDKIVELDAVYAIDQDGKDFKNEISSTDKKYYEMPLVGNTSNVYYDVPPEFEKTRNEIFLKTTGYYVVNTDKQRSEQKTLIDEILITPGKIIQYSMELYNQKMKSIAENKTFDGRKIK